MTNLIQSNSLHIPLAAGSVQAIVTSPPYWGLRAYDTGAQKSAELGAEPLHDCLGWARGENCGECYVCHMRQVAAECWRVLRDDGVMFLNLGDSYATGTKADRQQATGLLSHHTAQNIPRMGTPDGLKTKDLCGIPWRVAFALQADGWYLRSEIIWSKPNPMPESVTDRPTKAHEQVFLLSKRARYFWDAEAVKETAETARGGCDTSFRGNGSNRPGRDFSQIGTSGTRNARSVWTIATRSYSGSHSATYPVDLPLRAIKAATKPDDLVLDPFNGAATTGLSAAQLGRRYVGLDLSAAYLRMSRERLGLAALNGWQEGDGLQDTSSLEGLPLFGGL